ncbi:MAG: ROK family protein [Candidatus Bathyarchaeota archaeon]|nr:ROK family protein [Candidatus Bathyarchaeota archaeon]
MSSVAVDIGATKIRVAIGDEAGLGEKLIEHTDKENGPEGIPLQISRMIKELIDYPKAIGIGSIGPIDLNKGMITDTPNYPFNMIPVVEPLRELFQVPVRIVNDCAAAVKGEKRFGAGTDTDNLFYVTLSTGLGGGAIVDGHLLIGKDGNAVEIGHLTIYPDSKVMCGCGSPGHWEAFCSGKNIPYYARTMLKDLNWRKSLLHVLSGGNPKSFTAKMIFNAAKQGDNAALQIVEEIGKINAIGFANIVNAFDPEIITIGGSIALNNPDMILMPIKHYMPRHVINRIPKILITPLGEDVVLYGALAVALEAEE